MDIFKISFHHDLLISELEKNNAPDAAADTDPLAIFTKPEPTYSRIWFSGTQIHGDRAQLGMQILANYPSLRDTIADALADLHLIQPQGGKNVASIGEFIDQAKLNESLLLANQSFDYPPLPPTGIDFGLSNYKGLLADCMKVGFVVLTKAPSKNGFDLLLHAHTNLYTRFFEPLKALLPNDDLRIFSINLKRMDSEKKLFFELHNVNKAPHGAEEIHPESVL